MKFFTTSKISENIHETPEGYLVCVGVSIARTGEMLYSKDELPLDAGDDGIIKVTRDAVEVFRPETMASFQGKAVTIGHPQEFVAPENWGALTKGVIQNVRRGEGSEENDLVADLLITDSRAIEMVKAGLREVSCGYDAEYVQTGIGHAIQKNIIGNHLALVEQGRAGASYAINDHKGKGSKMKLGDKIKAIFAKAQDEALKVADEAPEEKKEEAKDAGVVNYDAVCAAMKDLGEKVAALAPKAKDEALEEKKEEKKEEAKDEEVAPSLEERLSKLEASVAKLLEMEAAEQSEEVGDADEEGEEKEEAKDEDVPVEALVGDTASRVEILAPGMKPEGKDIKVRAIEAAYKTTDGKAVIDRLTNGEALDTKNAVKVDTIFIAASELLKVTRNDQLASTKSTRDSIAALTPSGAMTPEKLNELNAKRWAGK